MCLWIRNSLEVYTGSKTVIIENLYRSSCWTRNYIHLVDPWRELQLNRKGAHKKRGLNWMWSPQLGERCISLLAVGGSPKTTSESATPNMCEKHLTRKRERSGWENRRRGPFSQFPPTRTPRWRKVRAPLSSDQKGSLWVWATLCTPCLQTTG